MTNEQKISMQDAETFRKAFLFEIENDLMRAYQMVINDLRGTNVNKKTSIHLQARLSELIIKRIKQ